jgi:hypothetical protein
MSAPLDVFLPRDDDNAHHEKDEYRTEADHL